MWWERNFDSVLEKVFAKRQFCTWSVIGKHCILRPPGSTKEKFVESKRHSAFPISYIRDCTQFLVKYYHTVSNKKELSWIEMYQSASSAHLLLFSFKIVGDAVGWGFVVRGSKPCHIQAVDPSGPAAAAGMKVCAQRGMLYCGVWASWWRSWAACIWTVGGILVSWAECLSDLSVDNHLIQLPFALFILHFFCPWGSS